MPSIPIILVRNRVPATLQTGVLARIGMAMRRHQRLIMGVQWLVVVFYFSLLIYPVFMPLPAEDAHIGLSSCWPPCCWGASGAAFFARKAC